MVRSDLPTTRRSFERELALPGWASGSSWGFDEVYESYWAELHEAPPGPIPALRIGPERLLVTLGALAGVVAHAAGVGDDEALLALTA